MQRELWGEKKLFFEKAYKSRNWLISELKSTRYTQQVFFIWRARNRREIEKWKPVLNKNFMFTDIKNSASVC